MGTGCSNKSSVEVGESDFRNILRSRSYSLKDEQLRIRRSLMCIASGSESTFIDLTTPRNGVSIKWKRGDLIGQGAYGDVYQCMNTKTGELLAIKHFTLSDDPKKIEKVFLNMKKEVSLLKHLNHKNIVRYFQTDLSEDMKSINVILELVPGGSLKSILEKYGPLELDVIRNYSIQLLQGLNYLHENRVIHRDLKSANILIASDGLLKVSDFGSSRKFEENDGLLCKSLRGSPYWMAPEVVAREFYSFSADIWSFGCVLIEMSTGRPPWSNHANETMKVLQLILKENSLPDIPSQNETLKNIIEKCLNRNPMLRPTTQELLLLDFFNLENEILSN